MFSRRQASFPDPLTPRGGPPVRGRAWRGSVLAVLTLAGVVNFLDRSALSIANTSVRAQLHFSGMQMGALLSGFSLVYGLAQLPAGWLLDRRGPRLVLSLGMLLWSVAQTATGAASSFLSLLLTRAGLGVGEAPFFPGGVKVVRDLYEEGERGLPMGVFNASTTLAQALAPPLLTLLLLMQGWRIMFAAIGIAGLLPAFAWYAIYRNLPAAATPVAALAGSRLLLSSRTMWGMMLGFSGVNYTAWLYLAWLPGYMQSAHRLSLAATGWLAGIPFLMGAAGMLVSGTVADVAMERGAAPLASRKLLIVAGMLCSAGCTLLVVRASSTAAAVLATGMALFFIHFAGTAAWGLVQAATPAPLVATASALQNCCSFLLASVAPVLTGHLLDVTHSFQLALFLCASVTLLGALAYAALVRAPIAGAGDAVT